MPPSRCVLFSPQSIVSVTPADWSADTCTAKQIAINMEKCVE